MAKYMLAGADVVMTASALLRHGPEYAEVLPDGLAEWMARKGFVAIDEFRGSLAVPAGGRRGGARAGGLRHCDAGGQRQRRRRLACAGGRGPAGTGSLRLSSDAGRAVAGKYPRPRVPAPDGGAAAAP